MPRARCSPLFHGLPIYPAAPYHRCAAQDGSGWASVCRVPAPSSPADQPPPHSAPALAIAAWRATPRSHRPPRCGSLARGAARHRSAYPAVHPTRAVGESRARSPLAPRPPAGAHTNGCAEAGSTPAAAPKIPAPKLRTGSSPEKTASHSSSNSSIPRAQRATQTGLARATQHF